MQTLKERSLHHEILHETAPLLLRRRSARRRNHLARKRAELVARIQNTATQYNLPEPLGCVARPGEQIGLLEKFPDPALN